LGRARDRHVRLQLQRHHAAIAQGACRPADVFRRCGAEPQCAKCVCDMRRMIQGAEQALRHAAE
jgi:bacterioferritin-associated ferredoxin